MKDNETKPSLTKILNLFFKECLIKQSKSINLKRAYQVDRIFFLQNA